MSSVEFDAQVDALRLGLVRLDTIINDVMVEGVDYGSIPGARDKKNLLMPGAEKAAFILRLAPTFSWQRTIGDGLREPPIHYGVTYHLHLGSSDGPIVAEGVGSCSSWETKYRYRDGMRTCPDCEKAGTIMRSKFADKVTGLKGWYCNDKKGGCGASFAPVDARITAQETGRVDNPDPHDLDNTLFKMAKKRAMVDGVKTATAGSARLTQDMEEPAVRVAANVPEAEVIASDESAFPSGFMTEATGTPTPDDVPTESRQEVVERVLTAARNRGFSKLGQVFKDAVARLGIEPPTKMDDLTVTDLHRLLHEWGAA